MNKFRLEILSVDGIVFKEEITSASFPTISGIITVLLGHVSLLTKLIGGEIVIGTLSGMKRIAISGGFLEINCNNISVVADFVAYVHKANKQKIRQAMELAKNMRSKRKKCKTLIV